jgi:hypothetical protein
MAMMCIGAWRITGRGKRAAATRRAAVAVEREWEERGAGRKEARGNVVGVRVWLPFICQGGKSRDVAGRTEASASGH